MKKGILLVGLLGLMVSGSLSLAATTASHTISVKVPAYIRISITKVVDATNNTVNDQKLVYNVQDSDISDTGLINKQIGAATVAVITNSTGGARVTTALNDAVELKPLLYTGATGLDGYNFTTSKGSQSVVVPYTLKGDLSSLVPNQTYQTTVTYTAAAQ